MLDEIQSFFEELQQPFSWPDNLPAITLGRDFRAESERHWRLAMQYLDELEAKIVELYAIGADVPAAIDLIDEVVAIIRRKDKAQDLRVREIGQLMQKRGAPIVRGLGS
jgi:hypothetical protein